MSRRFASKRMLRVTSPTRWSPSPRGRADRTLKRSGKLVTVTAEQLKKLDLMTHYFPKFTEAIGAPRAAKFYQVERQLNRILRAKIASLIPLAKPL